MYTLMKRALIQQSQRLTLIQLAGAVLMTMGIIALIIIALQSFTGNNTESESVFAATGFYFIMLGIALLFPDTLKGPDKISLSTMRVGVFMIISVFIFLVVKVGWNCHCLQDFTMNSSWSAIIIAALGSKAVQSLGENNLLAKSINNQNPLQQNTLFNNPGPLPGNAFHDPSAICSNTPDGPPKINKL